MTPPSSFFGVTRERKKIFTEILAIPRLSHKTIGQLSKFENVPNFREGRAAKSGQNCA